MKASLTKAADLFDAPLAQAARTIDALRPRSSRSGPAPAPAPAAEDAPASDEAPAAEAADQDAPAEGATTEG